MSRVTRAEAARRLGLHKSTMSRLVKQNPALLDESGLVDVAEIEELRRNVINPALQTRGPGASAASAPVAVHADPAPLPDEDRQSINLSRSRRERARAQNEELDLAERIGTTLLRSDVEASIAEAGEMMRQHVSQEVRDQAERLARIEDVREMEQALLSLFSDVMAQVSANLAAAVAEDVKPGAA